MKKHKTMIIFLIVFVILFGFYFLMSHINKTQAQKEQDETIMLTMIEELVSMEYSDGTSNMSFVKEDDVWKATDQKELALDNDMVEEIADSLSNIATIRILEGAEKLSEYGLDQPQYTITLQAEDGNETAIYIGNSIDENYYATIGDKTVVCVIEGSAVEVLQFDLSALETQEE